MIEFISLEEYKNNTLKKNEFNLQNFYNFYNFDKRFESLKSDFCECYFIDFIEKLFEYYGFEEGDNVVLIYNGDAFLFNGRFFYERYIINCDNKLSKADLAHKILLFLFALIDHIYSLFKKYKTEYSINLEEFKKCDFYKFYKKTQNIIDF